MYSLLFSPESSSGGNFVHIRVSPPIPLGKWSHIPPFLQWSCRFLSESIDIAFQYRWDQLHHACISEITNGEGHLTMRLIWVQFRTQAFYSFVTGIFVEQCESHISHYYADFSPCISLFKPNTDIESVPSTTP